MGSSRLFRGASTTTPLRVCVVDDDPTNLRLIAHFCSARTDLEVTALDDGRAALDQVESGSVDLLITDLRMPGLAGGELLDRAKERAPHLPVLVMTGFGSVEGAVEMLHRGADDYLTKPIRKETFLHRLDAILQRVQLAREVDRLRERPQSPLAPLIGQSPEIRTLKHQLPTDRKSVV